MRTKKTPNTEQHDDPSVTDFPALAAWLDAHAGRKQWSRRLGRTVAQAWTVHRGTRGATVIVVLFDPRDGTGFEIFTPIPAEDLGDGLEQLDRSLGWITPPVDDTPPPEA